MHLNTPRATALSTLTDDELREAVRRGRPGADEEGRRREVERAEAFEAIDPEDVRGDLW